MRKDAIEPKQPQHLLRTIHENGHGGLDVGSVLE
jgi:hypothetical protein